MCSWRRRRGARRRGAAWLRRSLGSSSRRNHHRRRLLGGANACLISAGGGIERNKWLGGIVAYRRRSAYRVGGIGVSAHLGGGSAANASVNGGSSRRRLGASANGSLIGVARQRNEIGVGVAWRRNGGNVAKMSRQRRSLAGGALSAAAHQHRS